jgi:hypothetical protein
LVSTNEVIGLCLFTLLHGLERSERRVALNVSDTTENDRQMYAQIVGKINTHLYWFFLQEEFRQLLKKYL